MTDTVESVLAEMRAEANVHTISMAHERTLQRLDGWADRLAAAHAREVGPVPMTEWQQLVARAEAADVLLREARESVEADAEAAYVNRVKAGGDDRMDLLARIDAHLSGATMQSRAGEGK